ncbi:MAG TPA: hypothetical protein VMJ10_29775 [Kofleriaceae bacterium]|nr:hypothetical protein [Kofleriaceae bacterium]
MKSLLVVALLVVGACRSHCARYAEMEAKCGDAADKDVNQRRTLARGMCEAADNADSSVAKAGARFANEADCADATDDCDAYKKCRDAVK